MRSAVLSDGAVAQLGERQNRTLEAGGSIPLCSTKNSRGQPLGWPLFSFGQNKFDGFYFPVIR